MSSKEAILNYPFEKYTVSETSLRAYLRELDLPEDKIKGMPPRSVIVDVGSDKFQNLAREIHELRPDIQVVSIDPTMALDPARRDVRLKLDGDKYYYYVGDRDDLYNYRLFHKERTRNAQPGTIAAKAPSIPLASGEVDLLVDRFGPVLYLADKDKLVDYINEIVRLLRVGGEARLFPVGCLDTNTYAQDDRWREKARAELEKILPYAEGVTYEFFYNMQGVGLIIKLEDQSG